MEGQDVKFAVAKIDNGKFGKREIRFETGRLARQAAGTAVVYLDDDSMLLSATTASKNPQEKFLAHSSAAKAVHLKMQF